MVSDMEFCPNCGTRLIPTRTKEGEKTALQLVCPKCDFKKRGTCKPAVTSMEIEHAHQESIAIIGKKEQKLRTLPTVKIECPKCGNNLSYAWQVQTRGSDESSTQFFRCTKCNYTFREYS